MGAPPARPLSDELSELTVRLIQEFSCLPDRIVRLVLRAHSSYYRALRSVDVSTAVRTVEAAARRDLISLRDLGDGKL